MRKITCSMAPRSDPADFVADASLMAAVEGFLDDQSPLPSTNPPPSNWRRLKMDRSVALWSALRT